MDVNTVTIENEKIRVTLSAEAFERYRARCQNRTETMPSGDERIHTAEKEARGKVLSDAMRALAHRQVIAKPVELDMLMAREDVFDEYVFEYLSDQGRYNPSELLQRADAGRIMSQGQTAELMDARAYAAGKMGEIDITELAALWRKIIAGDKPDDRREWRRLALMSNRNADPNIAEKIFEAATEEARIAHKYSQHYIAGYLNIEVLRPDLMPEQIGFQTYETEEI